MNIAQYSAVCLAILGNNSWYERSSQVDLERAHRELKNKIINACLKGIIDENTKIS